MLIKFNEGYLRLFCILNICSTLHHWDLESCKSTIKSTVFAWTQCGMMSGDASWALWPPGILVLRASLTSCNMQITFFLLAHWFQAKGHPFIRSILQAMLHLLLTATVVFGRANDLSSLKSAYLESSSLVFSSTDHTLGMEALFSRRETSGFTMLSAFGWVYL